MPDVVREVYIGLTENLRDQKRDVPPVPSFRRGVNRFRKIWDHHYPGLGAGFGLPLFYSPLTPVTAQWYHNQRNEKCADIELDYFRCASRVGLRNVQTGKECLAEFEDFKECISGFKSEERRWEMDRERYKQARDRIEPPPQFTTVRPFNRGQTCHLV
ncbi:uncharacterized protein LOC127729366 [Mytilus californianus]|uniref:uncharacterized protein LOC127729366 n=1 Tax=Mytilus californianus TaxID=6549 RepID=UPI00224727BF|nr:uncharacterized protein LOC127729366 [Mytilus californianus]